MLNIETAAPVAPANTGEAKPRRFDPRDLIDEKGNLLQLAYTTYETAFLLACSDKTVRRLLKRGLLKTSKAIRHKQITRESILAFLKATV